MITLVEAKGFRCLRWVRRPLGPFHVLAGPNGSGKSAFLDVIAFLGALVQRGAEAAVRERAPSFHDLTFRREGHPFELAVEVAIPEPIRQRLANTAFATLRYEVGVGLDAATGELSLVEERVIVRAPPEPPAPGQQIELFPRDPAAPATILSGKSGAAARTLVHKVPGGNDNYYSETYQEPGKGWIVAYKLGKRRSALGNLPEDESKFPATLWFKGFLADGFQALAPRGELLSRASPPGQAPRLAPDGANLPWVVADLEQKEPDRFQRWLGHVRAALPDLEGVRTVEREHDHHRHLVLRYAGGLEIPSWVAAQGTLRLLALTLPAFLPGWDGVHVVEEPENGLHPRAAEAAVRALASVQSAGAQILIATCSPVVLGVVATDQVLCFAKGEGGAAEVVSGEEHAAFPGGVLG